MKKFLLKHAILRMHCIVVLVVFSFFSLSIDISRLKKMLNTRLYETTQSPKRITYSHQHVDTYVGWRINIIFFVYSNMWFLVQGLPTKNRRGFGSYNKYFINYYKKYSFAQYSVLLCLYFFLFHNSIVVLLPALIFLKKEKKKMLAILDHGTNKCSSYQLIKIRS